MVYRIYNPKEPRPRHGAEFKQTSSAITRQNFDELKQSLQETAKRVASERGWDYSEMVHQHTFKIIE